MDCDIIEDVHGHADKLAHESLFRFCKLLMVGWI